VTVLMAVATMGMGMHAGSRGLGKPMAMVCRNVPGNHEAMCGNEQNAQSGY